MLILALSYRKMRKSANLFAGGAPKAVRAAGERGPEYLSMVGEGCISGFLLRCALSEGRQEEIAAALADTRKLYIAALQ